MVRNPSGCANDLAGKYPEHWMNAESLEDPFALEMLKSHDFEMRDKTLNGMLYHQRRILSDGELIFWSTPIKPNPRQLKLLSGEACASSLI